MKTGTPKGSEALVLYLNPSARGPSVRFRAADLQALDHNRSGNVTASDVESLPLKQIRGSRWDGSEVLVDLDATRSGVAARVFEWMKRYARPAAPTSYVDMPLALLNESPVERMHLACDSYAASTRSMRIPEVLDAVLRHADPKLGVLGQGLRDEHGSFRSYAIVKNGALDSRTATYDGKKAFLYVPATEPEVLAELQRAVAADPKYENIEVRSIERSELGTFEERMQLKFDRPGLFWVSSRCPALPHLRDDGYIVPGGRFGLELHHHDTRINIPSVKSTIETLLAKKTPAAQDEAAKLLSTMRGTVNALANQVLHYGKIFNATMSTSAGRSQAPCLTQNILHTYRTWISVHPEQKAEAKTWLAWATAAAKREYFDVWMSPPRLDEQTGLSRYVDETPSVAPEEEPHFYAGMQWDAEDIASDAAIREHGWDSMPQALVSAGPEKGKPRIHKLLPVCLNSLLYRYERDFEEIARELDYGSSAAWTRRAEKRRDTMHSTMWNEERGLFFDLYKGDDGKVTQNGHEDLRSFAPLWAGLATAAQAKKLQRRTRDFMRPGGLATATEASWNRLRSLNANYTERCQWGHKDIGWPISAYETAIALEHSGAKSLAHEIAYRWCHMVQEVMDSQGGLHFAEAGGYEAPVFEKMDVTHRSPSGAAGVGYGNQGAGHEGEGGGFRWGYDAYKLLSRMLPEKLREALGRHTSPDVVFDARVMLQGATDHRPRR